MIRFKTYYDDGTNEWRVIVDDRSLPTFGPFSDEQAAIERAELLNSAESDLLGECVAVLKRMGFNDWAEPSDGIHYVQCNYCGLSWEEGASPAHFPNCRLAAILGRVK